MPTKRDGTRGVAVAFWLILAFLALSVTGCELAVEEPQRTREEPQRSALSMAVVELPEYDAAVSAIDFDPPLKRESLLNSPKPVKLLAAVENKGTLPLSQLIVEARISSPRGEMYARDRVHLERLSPGETRVVEFESVTSPAALPRSAFYRIGVSVEALQAESNPYLQNNNREVVVRVVD